ncbi:MAG: DUF2242 domain-containing protein [Pseudomonadota bacterium]|nr:DUF2242 domain-containing protein [Pseudomonadota bacterium]
MPFVVVSRRLAMGLAPVVLAGCAGLSQGPAPLLNFQPESFNGAAHVRHFAAAPGRSCEAARRALLSQGYVLTATQADQITGRKYFQPTAEHHVQLEFRVVCAPELGDEQAAAVFVSGLKEQYVLRKVKDSASVGVGGIGSLSLPLEGSLDSMVKVASETVTDAALYERFFELVRGYLDRAPRPEPDLEPKPEPEPDTPNLPAARPVQ